MQTTSRSDDGFPLRSGRDHQVDRLADVPHLVVAQSACADPGGKSGRVRDASGMSESQLRER
jgi:hypothetical protein